MTIKKMEGPPSLRPLLTVPFAIKPRGSMALVPLGRIKEMTTAGHSNTLPSHETPISAAPAKRESAANQNNQQQVQEAQAEEDRLGDEVQRLVRGNTAIEALVNGQFGVSRVAQQTKLEQLLAAKEAALVKRESAANQNNQQQAQQAQAEEDRLDAQAEVTGSTGSPEKKAGTPESGRHPSVDRAQLSGPSTCASTPLPFMAFAEPHPAVADLGSKRFETRMRWIIVVESWLLISVLLLYLLLGLVATGAWTPMPTQQALSYSGQMDQALQASSFLEREGADEQNTTFGGGVVTSTKIYDGRITTSKLINGAITTSKLGDGGVTSTKIHDAHITTSKLTDGAITTGKLGDGGITTGKLGDSSVTEDKVTDGAITTGKLGDGGVTSTKIYDAHITTSKLNDGAITTSKLGDGGVTSTKIYDGHITTSKLTDGAITTGKLGDGSITTGKLGDSSVTEDKISIHTNQYYLGPSTESFTLSRPTSSSVTGKNFVLQGQGSEALLAGTGGDLVLKGGTGRHRDGVVRLAGRQVVVEAPMRTQPYQINQTTSALMIDLDHLQSDLLVINGDGVGEVRVSFLNCNVNNFGLKVRLINDMQGDADNIFVPESQCDKNQAIRLRPLDSEQFRCLPLSSEAFSLSQMSCPGEKTHIALTGSEAAIGTISLSAPGYVSLNATKGLLALSVVEIFPQEEVGTFVFANEKITEDHLGILFAVSSPGTQGSSAFMVSRVEMEVGMALVYLKNVGSFVNVGQGPLQLVFTLI